MNRTSIEYVLRQLDVTEFKHNGDWVTTSCPLAPWTHAGGLDRHPSFGVRESQGISGVHCFSCGFKGGMLSLVRDYGRHAVADGMMSEEDVKQLEDYVILAEMEDEVEKPLNRISEVMISDQLRDCLNRKHSYFTKRNITDEMGKLWNLGFADSFTDSRTGFVMENRALFPVYDKRSGKLELKGIIGRTVTGEDPKYKNAPPNFQKAKYLYGSWLIEGQRRIVVVEGPVDCIMLNQKLKEAGMDEEFFAVSLMGADPSTSQIDYLKDLSDEVICMLDNDPSGKLGVKKLIDGLEAHLLVSVVEWKAGTKDPDEAGEYAVEMIKNRISVLEHRLKRVLGKNEQC